MLPPNIRELYLRPPPQACRGVSTCTFWRGETKTKKLKYKDKQCFTEADYLDPLVTEVRTVQQA